MIQSRASERLPRGGGTGGEGGRPRGSAGAVGRRLGAFLGNEGISRPEPGRSRWSVPSNRRNDSPVSVRSGHAAGSATTKIFSLPLPHEVEGSGCAFSRALPSPPCTDACGRPPGHAPHRLRIYSVCHCLLVGGRDRVDGRREGRRQRCVWFNQMGFCSLRSCLRSILDCVALSHLNMIMGVFFFYLYHLVFSRSLNMVANL